MPVNWLALDCDFFCHRALHSTGMLAHDDSSTGVVFGFLRAVADLLADPFVGAPAARTVFCWDGAGSLRRDLFPGYKAARLRQRDVTLDDPLAADGHKQFRKQVRQLRDEIVPEIFGPGLVWSAAGYEADDCLAVAALRARAERGCNLVIASTDKDLYQTLAENVQLLTFPQNRRPELFTAADFRTRFYGLPPAAYAQIRALAGCSTDNVPGAAGVGDVTAVKHFAEKPVQGTRKRAVEKFLASREYGRNLRLVTLPFDTRLQTLLPPLSPAGSPDVTSWKRVCDRFGLKSLRDRCPR